MRIVTLSIAILVTLSLQAGTYLPKGKVEFTAKGYPTFITIKGNGEGLQGTMELEGQRVDSAVISFPLKALTTGMDLRDEHMHEKYLETSKYPMATLTLPSFELRDSGEVEGELNLHNVTKKIKVSYEATKGEVLETEAKFKIVLADFGIEIPSFQGITVAKEINLAVNLQASRK